MTAKTARVVQSVPCPPYNNAMDEDEE
jgi:hypothetical protein